MAMKDPYTILGVTRSASDAEIKSAYRKLAKELHPDLNPDDPIVEQRFKEVSGAYALLSDTDKRAQFDHGEINADGSPARGYARGHAQGASGGFGGGGFGSGFGGGGGFGGFGGFSGDDDDFFGDIFRRAHAAGGAGAAGARGRTRTVKMRGKDVNYTITVDFEDAVRGGKRRLNLYDGSSVNLDIPPGSGNGQTLRLKGKGMQGMGGGEAGDALVELQVAPHPHFERDGNDIFLQFPITLSEAVLGAKLKAPTIHGPVAVKIPAGSNTGSSLRLTGKGVKPRKGAAGDQYIQLKVILPDTVDEKLRNFVETWSGDYDYDVRKRRGFDE